MGIQLNTHNFLQQKIRYYSSQAIDSVAAVAAGATIDPAGVR
jgi:hypothetical protein